ncbi:MAG: response regulator [Gammaproteobacteria bacterium]|nr:response regulator [Gammaproteobacteria bacterium]
MWFVFFVSASLNIAAELTPSLKFKALKSQLSQVTVNDLEKDELNYIWIATNSGLNRFDGYEVKVYLEDKGKAIQLHRDDKGSLHALTESGVFKYSATKDNFTELKQFLNQDVDYSNVTDFFLKDDLLYLSTKAGTVVELGANSFTSFSLNRNINANDLVNYPYTLYVNERGVIFVGTNYGVWSKSLSDSAFEVIESTKLFSVRSILKLANNQFALATSSGLVLLNDQGEVRQYDFSSNTNVDKRFTDVVATGNENLWLAGFNGLVKFNYKTQDFHFYQHKPALAHSLSSNNIKSLLFNDNVLWVGTETSGVNYVAFDTLEFGLFQSQYQTPECLSGNVIYSLDGDTDVMWVASYGIGVHGINLRDGTCIKLSAENGDSISSNYVIFVEATDSDVWIGHSGAGLSRYNKATKEITNYKREPNNPNSLVHQDVFAIKEDNDKNIWIGTQFGLSKLKPESNEFKNFKLNNSDLHNFQINALEIDNKNQLWIGSEKGVDVYNIEREEFVRNELSQKLQDLNASILTIKSTQLGDLWIGTLSKGLWRIDKDGIISIWSNTSGLRDNTVYRIEEDKYGNIWFTSNKTLTRLEPDTGVMRHYESKHGLLSGEFTQAGFYNPMNNTLFIAGTDGFNRVNLGKLTAESEASSPLISKFLIENKEFPLQNSLPISNGESILTANALKLDYTFDFIGFEFISSDYYFSDSLGFRYKLDGFSSKWIETSADNRTATFTNLPHGNFKLLVDVTDRHGRYQNKPTELQISIAPPFWLTWWAKTIYILLLVLGPYGIYFYRSRALREKARKLEAAVNKRTAELSHEKKTVERLLDFKNEEFANVSHEFRTPLTLVLGPLKRLLESEQDDSKRRRMNIIKSNAYRLLRMVDQLIFMEKFRFKQEAKKKSINVSQLVDEYVTNFRDLAAEKDITINLRSDEGIFFESLPDAIQKILLNLISNALKYTPNGGSIDVSLKTISKELFEFKVSDTGIGIEPIMHDKIFDRYSRVLDDKSEKVTGAGIGLSLVKELVEYHGGNIRVESACGVGSSFILTLPQHFLTISGESRDSIEGERIETDELLDIEIENLTSQLSSEAHTHAAVTKSTDEMVADKTTVLVIDDNPSIRNYLQDILMLEYNVLLAENGQQGIEVATQYIPDLIISDIMMPTVDGYQLTESLKSNLLTSHIPIILLTARGDTESRLKGWKINADEYLTKPFDEDELKLRITNLLSIRQLIQMRFAANRDNEPAEKQSEEEETLSSVDKKFLENCEAIIEENYKDNQFAPQALASNIGLSDRQLQRKIKGLLGQSPSDYIRNFRLKKAKLALESGDPIKKVTFEHGFSSVSYFTRCYKAFYGVTPGQILSN